MAKSRVARAAPIDRLGFVGHLIRSSLLKAILHGTQVVVALQRHRTPTRNALMRFVTAFGHEDFYTALVPVLTWIVDPRLGFLFLIVLATSFYVSGSLKNLVLLPRPPSPPVEPLERSTDWAMPSLHAITGVVGPWYIFFYAYLNYELSESTRVALFGVMTVWSISVIFSRLYLGVHSPVDLVVGGAVGCLVVVAWLQIDTYFENYVASHRNSYIAVLFGFILMIFLHPRSKDHYSVSFYDSVSLLGLASGAVLGRLRTVGDIHLSASLLEMPTEKNLYLLIGLRMLLGTAATFLGRVILKMLLRPLIRCLIYAAGFEVVSATEMLKEQVLNVHYSEAFCLPGDVDDDDEVKKTNRKKGEEKKRSRHTIDIDIPLKFCLYSIMGWLALEGMPSLFYQLGI